MAEELINNITPASWVVSDSIIKVIGVGGGGCNAVNHMLEAGIQGCSFVVCNTDSQVLNRSQVPVKIQLGLGLGAGTDPVKGRNAALEKQQEIQRLVMDTDTQMLFITAGMGGGTGTGASPVIAKMAKEQGILTVGVVTLPFKAEGAEVRSRAIDGIHELEKYVDSLIVINNEKIYAHYGKMLMQDAFPKADEVLATAVRAIIEIIKKKGHINVDFQDVKTMMQDSGMALMGIGEGSGKNRIEDAVSGAFKSPLLNDFDLKTARKVLVNITVGRNKDGVTMEEFDIINHKIAAFTGSANNFKTGIVFDDNPEVGDKIRITAIATGFTFNTLIGADPADQGKFIQITRNFVYAPQTAKKGEGRSLGGYSYSTPNQIGKPKASQGSFEYDADKEPMTLKNDPAILQELETRPAIERIQK